MSRFISLEEFRKRFEVVQGDDLTAQEPYRDWDPFVEKESDKRK